MTGQAKRLVLKTSEIQANLDWCILDSPPNYPQLRHSPKPQLPLP